MTSPALFTSPNRRPGSREAASSDSISDDLEAWSRQKSPRTIGSLIETFGPRSFAVLFVVLLALPALPLPTGGLSHLFEAVAMLLALELIIGQDDVWVPRRWESKAIKGVSPAFLAPPFSGLDTLPAVGVVMISLGMLFGDALIVAIGGTIGAAGIAVVVGLGSSDRPPRLALAGQRTRAGRAQMGR